MPTKRSPGSPSSRPRKARAGILICEGCRGGGSDTFWLNANYACPICGQVNTRLFRHDHADRSAVRGMSPRAIAAELAADDWRGARA